MDSLKQYHAKRNFANTPEPRDGGDTQAQQQVFVIHKHWASSLHYDLRLELGGTLKSWAVPKGPSFDPLEKRLAVQVEDHPIAYSSFEGSIPAKQYGAGKVVLWDSGFWYPVGDAAQGYHQGNLKFELDGHKLRGKWVLVRLRGKGEKQMPWLLIKERDGFARASSEYSVVDVMPDSVKMLKPVKRRVANTVPEEPPKILPEKLPKRSEQQAAATQDIAPATLPSAAVASALPDKLEPQLATLAAAPASDAAQWIYEIKFDGYRLLTRIDRVVSFFTRNGHDWTAKLQPLQQAVSRLMLPAGWYDGEIVLPDPHGLPDFGALQAAFDTERTRDIVLYLFDLPYFDGYDLRAVPLQLRRRLLQQTLAGRASDQVRFSEAFDAPAGDLVASACKLGLEGLIGKRRDALYSHGRSASWIKIKCKQRQEFVIGGYTKPQGQRSGFGALLLGIHDAQGVLRYAGNVGSGFSQQALATLMGQLLPRAVATSPFADGTGIEGKPHWVKPELLAEVSFAEWTRSGRIRHASFHGLRNDKPASAIVREALVVAATPQQAAPLLGGGPAITHPERVIDASSGTTKLELANYYRLVGELMMLHLKDRPVSLVRAPSGVGGELFFQKHADTRTLPGVESLDPALYISHPALLTVTGVQGLLSAAQWNVVEFHTFNTGIRSLEYPDRLIFDLDPGAGVAWQQVQEAAELVHAFLAQLGLTAFLKTSGGKGLHVVVPIASCHDWDTVEGFTDAVALHMANTIPQRFVAKSGPKNRVGKIFIDTLRNRLGATTVCAWSARARPGMGISVPLGWDELAALPGSDHWTVRTAHTRLKHGNDAWNGYDKAACRLTEPIKILGYSARR